MTSKLKFIVDEDFVNYKDISMFIGFPRCGFKCDYENGKTICQNQPLVSMPDINITPMTIVKRYLDNPLSKAIVFGGLEPFDTVEDMFKLIFAFRRYTDDPIIIYTGYTEEELKQTLLLPHLENKNIIIKFGRFIPNQSPHFDEVLGVNLASDNQYAKKI